MSNVLVDAGPPLMLWNLIKILQSIFSVRLNNFVKIMMQSDEDGDIVFRQANIISVYSTSVNSMLNLQQALEEKAIRHQRIIKVQFTLIFCLLFSLFLLYLSSACVNT
jgi:hypothetical protein